MPRTLPANAITEIAKPLGVEPINIIGVDWASNGTEILYADRDLMGVLGRILELGEFDEVVKATGNSTVSVRVSLDDTDGELKTIYNTTDLHKKRCSVYQYFGGLSLDDKFLLFRGEISTPVVWDEGKRTLSFDILSKIESEEVGFSPEEGQFTDVASAAIGKVWPLCFGSVAHVPVVKTSDVIRGNLVTTIGIPDATLPIKRKQLVFNLNYYIKALAYYSKVMEVAYTIARPPIDIASDYLVTIKTEDALKQSVETYSELYEEKKEELDKLLELIHEAPTADRAEGIQNAINALRPLVDAFKYELELIKPKLDYAEAYKEYVEIEIDNAQYEFETIGKLREAIVKILEYINETAFELNHIDAVTAQQRHLSQTVFTVVNGHKFPQATPIRLVCKGMILIGSFAGDVFTMTQIEPRYRNVAIAPRQSTGQSIIAQESISAYGMTIQVKSMDLTDLNAFWITDATNELAGNYCLLSTGKIIKVSDQIGTKCFFDLEEIRIDKEKEKPYEPAEEKDLTTWLWGQIAASGAREYTVKERERKLREALSKDAKESLKNVEDRLEKLIELIDEAPTEERRRGIQEAIYHDMGAYESIVASLRVPRKDKLEAYRLISREEFNNFLKLENLHRKEYWRAVQPPVIDVPGNYAVTGPQVIGAISEVAPVILPSWLPFLKDQLLSDLEEITTKLPNDQTILVDKIPRTTLWVAEGGTTVTLDTSYQEKYICNILPSTIQAVYANRAVNGFKRLVPVPSSYYVKNEADNYGPYSCTTITLRKPLSEYDDEGWEGDLYVSLVSSVGPNTALIIKWILQQYTNTVIDDTSFDYVEDRLTNYPSHFALFSKQDALSLVEKIAWQARCNLLLKHGTAYLQYLSEIPDSIATIEQSDIEHESLEISYTGTEDLVTKFVAKWKTHYQQDDENKTILRHNIIKYGNIEKEFDFFIYNIESLVIKSATFWMIRYTNTWKKIKFKTFLTNLKIESFDAITIDLGDSLVASGSVLGLVEKASYDSGDYSITIECWLPVRAGEMVTYNYAFPADLSAETVFPTIEDVAAGVAGGDSRIPTGTSFSLRQPHETEYIELRPKDYGSRFPSDAADTVPLNPLAGYYEVDFKIQKISEYLMRTLPGVTSAATGRSAGQRPDQPEPEDNNWIGRVDRYNGPKTECIAQINQQIIDSNFEIIDGVKPAPMLALEQKIADLTALPDEEFKTIGYYKVSKSDSKVFDVFELGYETTKPTKEGVRVSVVWNKTVRRYEMIRRKDDVQIMQEFQIITPYDNYMLCRNIQGVIYYVAKPYSLQFAPWDGQTITLNGVEVTLAYADGSHRTVTGEGLSEAQVIVPDFIIDEWIVGWKTKTDYLDPENRPIEWLDMNSPARNWTADVGASTTINTFLAEIVLSSGSGYLTSYIVNVFDNANGKRTKEIQHLRQLIIDARAIRPVPDNLDSTIADIEAEITRVSELPDSEFMPAALYEDPIHTGLEVFQLEVPLKPYFNGELVSVRVLGGIWRIGKLANSPLATIFEDGQVVCRGAQRNLPTQTPLQFTGPAATYYNGVAATSTTYTLVDAFYEYNTLYQYFFANATSTGLTLAGGTHNVGTTMYFFKDSLAPMLNRNGITHSRVTLFRQSAEIYDYNFVPWFQQLAISQPLAASISPEPYDNLVLNLIRRSPPVFSGSATGSRFTLDGFATIVGSNTLTLAGSGIFSAGSPVTVANTVGATHLFATKMQSATRQLDLPNNNVITNTNYTALGLPVTPTQTPLTGETVLLVITSSEDSIPTGNISSFVYYLQEKFLDPDFKLTGFATLKAQVTSNPLAFTEYTASITIN